MMFRVIAATLLASLAAPMALAQGDNTPPAQVSVSVKIIEFQTSKDVDTGLSAYFAQRAKVDNYGRVTMNGALRTADITFPTETQGGLAVFLDRIRWGDGDIEMVLQALVDENRAFILSRPKTMVVVESGKPTEIKTVQKLPYESTQVVGNAAIPVTAFKDTGVTLTISVPQVIDDDANWSTNDDTFVRMDVQAAVLEEGQRITVALDQTAVGGPSAQNAFLVPEFVSRSINTHVWVRNGQVLVLGGLFRNTNEKSLSTVPWLLQGEDLAIGLAENVIPGNFLASPLSATIGDRSLSDGRRELVFLIKCEIWRPAYTITDTHGFDESDETKKKSPTDVITDIVQGISEIPGGLANQPGPRDDNVGSNLGGGRD